MKKDLIVNDKPKSPISESIRLLRTNLSYITSDLDSKVFLVTSCAPGEGKSWVSSNLSSAFAQTGKKVLLVDSDLRKGRQDKVFNVSNSNGFSDYLKNINQFKNNSELHNNILSKLVIPTKVPNLWVIPSGSFVINPSELLSSSSIDLFLSIMSQSFDVIIFDGAPVSIVADSLELCKKVNYVVFVVAAEQTKKDIILNSKKAIEKVGGKIAGVVLNKVPQSRVKEYSKYYSKYDENYKIKEYNNPTLSFNTDIKDTMQDINNIERNTADIITNPNKIVKELRQRAIEYDIQNSSEDEAKKRRRSY